MEATNQLNTLLQFRLNPEFRAGNGSHGEGSNRHGQNGEDVMIPVPVGTLVINHETQETLYDLVEPGQRVVIARGGRGGRGNARFATSINRAPRYHQDGEPGDVISLQLELRLIADVGLVGFPNAGKSTLLSRISAARPKIADYPFTTLEPNLGVVSWDDEKTFVVADIPGLIEGAHEGAGLGLDFLRHIERTSILAHVIDISSVSGRDAVEDFLIIENELNQYKAELGEKPRVIVASKMDALDDESRLDRLRSFCQERGLELIEVSSVTGKGISTLKRNLGKRIENAAALNRSNNTVIPESADPAGAVSR